MMINHYRLYSFEPVPSATTSIDVRIVTTAVSGISSSKSPF
jgi:hypothetical protein